MPEVFFSLGCLCGGEKTYSHWHTRHSCLAGWPLLCRQGVAGISDLQCKNIRGHWSEPWGVVWGELNLSVYAWQRELKLSLSSWVTQCWHSKDTWWQCTQARGYPLSPTSHSSQSLQPLQPFSTVLNEITSCGGDNIKNTWTCPAVANIRWSETLNRSVLATWRLTGKQWVSLSNL